MKVTAIVQRPKMPIGQSIIGRISSWPRIRECAELRIAVAYATVSGVRALLAALSRAQLQRTYWLIGLDDAISQPGAIDLILGIDGSELRVAGYQAKSQRFHPKVFQFLFEPHTTPHVSFVGSANLTSSALQENGEAVVALEREGKDDDVTLERLWLELWKQGQVPTLNEL